MVLQILLLYILFAVLLGCFSKIAIQAVQGSYVSLIIFHPEALIIVATLLRSRFWLCASVSGPIKGITVPTQ